MPEIEHCQKLSVARFELGIGIGHWNGGLGLGIGIRDLDWALGLGIGDLDEDLGNRIVD